MTQKPISILREEFTKEIFETISKYTKGGMSLYHMDPVLGSIHANVQNMIAQQEQIERQAYLEAQKKEEEEKNGDNKASE